MTCYILTQSLLLAVIVTRYFVASCSFPEKMQMNTHDPPWYSHVRTDGSRDSEYYIRHNVMEIHYPRSDRPNVRWKCTMPFHDKLLLKRQDHLVNTYYRCVRFVFRSRSVVQILWSHEIKTFDLELCDDRNLKPDPWILIWYGSLKDDWVPCGFSGGFDMKIVDSQLGENGCNLMLRPMRMEAECLGGEGVMFNFMSSNCLPAIRMYVKQRTICVTQWQDSRNHYTVLRRNEDTDLWCLVMPVLRTSSITAYLFSDLACVSDTDQLSVITDIRFFTLYLHTRLFSNLCEDEYDQCSKVTCNMYVKQECQKSCGMCDSTSYPPECEFPQDFHGSWFLKYASGYNHIDISSSNVTIDGVGQFICASYSSGSATRTSARYTTISLFNNGCRPRYTCINLHRVGPSVLQYSLSQSYLWPHFANDLSNIICSNDRFHPDPSPIDDLYRPHEGSGKPIIAQMPKAVSVTCNLTSVFIVNATFAQGHECSGSLYRHCENSSYIRLDFNTCGDLIPASTDYMCLANYAGHYWERIVLVQNIHDEMDVVCFVFSQFYPNETYILVASQCDQKSFSFARSGLRQPRLKLGIQKEGESCKSSPKILTTPQTQSYSDSSKLGYSGGEDHEDYSELTNMTETDPGYHSPVSIVESGSLSDKTDHVHHKGTYLDTRVGLKVPTAKSTSFSDGDSLRAKPDNEGKSLSPVFSLTFMIAVMSVVSINYCCLYIAML